jgi:hypothetical protein
MRARAVMLSRPGVRLARGDPRANVLVGFGWPSRTGLDFVTPTRHPARWRSQLSGTPRPKALPEQWLGRSAALGGRRTDRPERASRPSERDPPRLILSRNGPRGKAHGGQPRTHLCGPLIDPPPPPLVLPGGSGSSCLAVHHAQGRAAGPRPSGRIGADLTDAGGGFGLTVATRAGGAPRSCQLDPDPHAGSVAADRVRYPEPRARHPRGPGRR